MADKRGKPTGLFVGGLVLDIVAIIGYFIALIVILIMMAVVVTMGATTGAVVAGEEGAQQAVDQVSHDQTFIMLGTIFGCLSGYSLVVGLPVLLWRYHFVKKPIVEVLLELRESLAYLLPYPRYLFLWN